jgi:hypothetical protein
MIHGPFQFLTELELKIKIGYSFMTSYSNGEATGDYPMSMSRSHNYLTQVSEHKRFNFWNSDLLLISKQFLNLLSIFKYLTFITDRFLILFCLGVP